MEENIKDNIICRCEEITREEIIEAIRKGDTDLGSIKRRTRSGMGLCQGKTCAKLIARIIAEETGKNLGDIKVQSFRQPVNPITLGAMASGANKDIILDIEDLEDK